MKRRRIQSLISTLLLVISVVLLIAVGVLFIRDRRDDDTPVAPTPIAGHNQAIDVLNALKDQDLDAHFGDQGSDVRSEMLERPGQTIELPDGTVYVFIYPDFDARDDATLDVLAEDVDLVDVAGDPIDVDEATLFTNSNVAVLIVASDPDTIAKVEQAVNELR
jgi:hypothetical protein